MSDASDILDKAHARAKLAKDGWSEIYQSARDDLHFQSDKAYCQWDEQMANDRIKIGRPTLQIDQLTQFVHQVSNDIRMNTPTIKVIPDGMDANPETAEAISGRIKAIEYKSNADAAYDMAADFSVKSSIGFLRLDHDYISDDGFEQELIIKRVTNPLAIYLDPDSTEPDGSDAKYAFVYDEISSEEFARRWPDAAPISFGDEVKVKKTNEADMIVIAEYFCFSDEESEIGLLPDGKKEAFDKAKKYTSRRKSVKRKVLRYKLSGQHILEETTFPGKYIPIVPVYGEEAWENGKRHLFSLIRKSKSAQQMYNLWKSLETELLLKQQQAPVQAAVGQMRGFEDDWKKPDKAMVLYYHQTDIEGNEAPAPQRLQPPTIPTGIVNAARETVDDIKSTMGLYNASIGVKSNETSGIAIQSRQKEGDVATFHFGDNLVRSITHIGKIIVCALPEIEDTPRVVQTIGLEDEHKAIGINGKMVDGQEHAYDFTKGQYDVRVITGPSFTTQRQEAAATYAEIIKTMPDLMPVIGDLVFKYQDVPGALAISTRLKKLVDPKFLDEKEHEGSQDTQAMQMQAQLQQITQEAQAQIQALQQELQSKQGDTQVKMAEVQIKAQEVEIKKGELQLKIMQAQQPEAPVSDDSFDKQLKAKELEIKAFDAETKRMAAMQKSSESQMGIKLDTNGFQIMKTPEQLQMEEQEMLMRSQSDQAQREQEAAEMQAKQVQTQMVIEALGNISAQLSGLTASVSQPITVMRDDAGNITGAV